MKKFNRAVRRQNKERMKKRAQEIHPYFNHAYKLADHLKYCSCNICCNIRRSGYTKEKLTIQEQNAEIKLSEQLKEID